MNQLLALFVSISSFSAFAYSNCMKSSISPDACFSESRRQLVIYDDDGHGGKPMMIGYAHNVQSGKAEQAIEDGIDVLIWSFFHMHWDDEKHQAMIRTSLHLDGIRKLRDKYDHVIHLAAFGGWNGPHPPVVSTDVAKSLSGRMWCDVFIEFNKSLGYLFDGIDWDYEGHDDLKSETSKFSIETLDIMADFSIAAKEYGMIVSMAPAESYLDSTAILEGLDSKFSLELNLPPRAWTSSEYGASDEDRELIKSAGFSHAGRQCYAYVLAKAGIETFDWVSIQLYEAYSPFSHDISRKKIEQSQALITRVNSLLDGYTVTGIPPPLAPEFKVKIPANKLVIGVANGWADDIKFCRVTPNALRAAYDKTKEKYKKGYLGIMFWTIEEEGNDDNTRLAKMLHRVFGFDKKSEDSCNRLD
ncbi:hypothetical protein ACHAXS_006199 [Conticribra weissflogii]